jgi:predicted Zn-dependent peptidase
VAGHVTVEQVKQLAEKWFGDIPSGKKYARTLPQEPLQRTARQLEVHAKVPIDAIYKCWHIYPRLDQRYYITDLLSEILGGGASSRLFQSLVKEKQLFSNIECYHFGTIDAGLLTIDGKLVKGVSMQDAEAAIEEELEKLKAFAIEEKELQKVKNKTESLIAFEDMSLMNRANSLAFYTLLGDTSMINDELRRYNSVTPADIKEDAITIFDPGNSNTLYYYAGN